MKLLCSLTLPENNYLQYLDLSIYQDKILAIFFTSRVDEQKQLSELSKK